MSTLVSKLSVFWALFVCQFRTLFSTPDREPADFPFATSDVAQWYRLRCDPQAASIDDATWKDLLLDRYCARLSNELSIFGQHVLYQRLRAGRGDTGSVRQLMQDSARLEQLHRTCKSLRHADKEIATLLFEDPAPDIPWWVGKTWLLPLLMAASLAAVIWSPLALLATGLVCYILITVQMRYYERVEQWQRSMLSLQMLLRVVSLLNGDDAAQAGKINRGLTRSPFAELLPGARGYQDWFLLENVKHYFKGAGLVHANLEFVRACFVRIANLEADVALARHLFKVQRFCWAAHDDVSTMSLEQVVHPLLPDAQPLSLELKERGAFVSGQNGIGKSTLLRTVGLNLVVARAFGFCYADNARVPNLPVYASMQTEDSLLGGESLYMAELRRAKELLAASEGPHPGVYIVDEIFKGTNHLESVSAAASVLDVLAEKGLVIVSSHNLVLAALLAHRLEPLCIARVENAGNAIRLSRGVLAHTNGIALLSQGAFGSKVEENARKVFNWLSDYLAYPDDCSSVLAGRSQVPTATLV
ncbi:MAG: hypothetical protein JWP34_3318 [Massilia sp.]|jgi:hypothetical protein|nr:hypothetical protein [Massilia sp.]